MVIPPDTHSQPHAQRLNGKVCAIVCPGFSSYRICASLAHSVKQLCIIIIIIIIIIITSVCCVYVL